MIKKKPVKNNVSRYPKPSKNRQPEVDESDLEIGFDTTSPADLAVDTDNGGGIGSPPDFDDEDEEAATKLPRNRAQRSH